MQFEALYLQLEIYPLKEDRCFIFIIIFQLLCQFDIRRFVRGNFLLHVLNYYPFDELENNLPNDCSSSCSSNPSNRTNGDSNTSICSAHDRYRRHCDWRRWWKWRSWRRRWRWWCKLP